MGDKIPFKYGSKPVQSFKLDNKDDRATLGIQKFWNIDPAKPPKHSDRYIRYTNGKYGIVELKPSALKYAPEQLKKSAEMLVDAEKTVDYLIVVLEDLSAFEREHLYEVRNGILCKRSDGKPYPVLVGSRHLYVEVFRETQVDNMWVGDNKLFGGS